MISLRTTGLALGAAFSLSACVSVLPDAPPASPRYGLSYIDPEARLSATGAFTLAVDDPLATRAIDSAKIAYVNDAEQYRYYAGAEWADRAPRLFMAALVRSFQNVDGLIGVGSRSSQPISDYILQTDLRAFEARQNGDGAMAHVDIYARVTDVRGRAFGARLFSVERPVSSRLEGGEGGAAALALNDAAGELLDEIVDWSLGVIDDQETKKAGS